MNRLRRKGRREDGQRGGRKEEKGKRKLQDAENIPVLFVSSFESSWILSMLLLTIEFFNSSTRFKDLVYRQMVRERERKISQSAVDTSLSLFSRTSPSWPEFSLPGISIRPQNLKPSPHNEAAAASLKF